MRSDCLFFSFFWLELKHAMKTTFTFKLNAKTNCSDLPENKTCLSLLHTMHVLHGFQVFQVLGSFLTYLPWLCNFFATKVNA